MTRLHVPIPLRWSDFDAYGHVNNAEMLRLFEEARIHAFWVTDEGDGKAQVDTLGTPLTTRVLDGRPGAATLTLIARQEIEYLLPIPYLRQPIDIQLWLGRLGGASLEVCYEVHSPLEASDDLIFARATTTIVLVDAATQRPRRITATERAAWEPYLEAPVAFSRR
ncbi:acyl-CoA thioesterase [Leifsonia sp. Root112D2]|uniref:acyl-CoA thioesterase n=1 Tax=Leifsonia sp. Root112D2 TaxID=1736426 RepID=UPI0006FF517E|nr:thioesterase family protein [Leifsonia sp. Root112D2]KQV07775.1 4-hydroxybenzoyl-CoA thioesterase [Leifsonia sp. Root112D2]